MSIKRISAICVYFLTKKLQKDVSGIKKDLAGVRIDIKRLDPKVDVVFKQIFGAEKNKTILISFLNAVFALPEENQITALEILNPYLEQEHIDDSYGILDIKIQLGSGDMVDVEVQIGDRANMERRSTYYICRMFGDQKIIKGRYQNLKRTVAINILDFVRIKDSRCYHTTFRLLELEEKIELTDAIEIHFIELPKLSEEMANHADPLDRWVMFLKGWDDMELLKRLSEEDPAIARAKQTLEEMAADPRAKEIYELRLKAILDRNSDLYEAEMKGEMKGKLEGKLEGKQEAARNALKKGLLLEDIAEITGLSLETVQKLKAELSCARHLRN
ncbi:MAG: Rpn family recombination-promoting nuclease/putative transposase [Bacillota bacterium]|nr:Rpn family recombination-promoting nuclease/putative transposase [Bacillota bacterium]